MTVIDWGRPVLIKFTSKLTRDSVLERSKLLKGTGIYLEKDYEKPVREIRKQLIPFMKEARVKVRHAVLRGVKLIVEGRELDLNFCKRKLGDHRREDLVDQPGREMGEMSTLAEAGQRRNIETRSTHAGGGVTKSCKDQQGAQTCGYGEKENIRDKNARLARRGVIANS